MIRHLRIFLPFVLVFTLLCDSPDDRKGAISLELGDYAMAETFYNRILEKNPADFNARLGMGKALLQRASANCDDTVSWRRAVMHLEAARTLIPSPEIRLLLCQVWSQRASDLLGRSDTLSSLEALTRAITADPSCSEPLNLAGIIYYRMGRVEKARQIFMQAVAADSMNTASLFNLGMLHWEEGRTKEAHSLWRRALTIAPRDEEFLYWFAAAEKNLRAAASDTTGQRVAVQ